MLNSSNGVGDYFQKCIEREAALGLDKLTLVVTERDKEKFQTLFRKHGITDMPALDSLVTEEEIAAGLGPITPQQKLVEDQIEESARATIDLLDKLAPINPPKGAFNEDGEII